MKKKDSFEEKREKNSGRNGIPVICRFFLNDRYVIDRYGCNNFRKRFRVTITRVIKIISRRLNGTLPTSVDCDQTNPPIHYVRFTDALIPFRFRVFLLL